MRPLIFFAVLAVALVGLSQAAEITKGQLKAGEAVPGAFHPYNVTVRVLTPEEAAEAEIESGLKGKNEKDKYTTKGKYHCLVTEYDLDPVVMLLARGLDDSAGFKELLKKLDSAIENNRVRRLRAFVVFLDEKIKDIVADDDRRGEMVKTAEKVAKDAELKNIVLTVASKDDLKKYDVESHMFKDADSAALVAVLYKSLRIKSSHSFLSSELDKEDAPAVDAILKATTEMINPKR